MAEEHVLCWHNIEALRRQVLSFLSPREILRASSTSRGFRFAAQHVDAISLVQATPMNTSLAHVARFFRGARQLRLTQCYLPTDSLHALATFAHLRDLDLSDVAFLQDGHVAAITRGASQLTSLTVVSCHLLAHVHIFAPRSLSHVRFERNMNLKQLQISGDNVVVTHLTVTASATFQQADALVHALPSLTHASFAECGMLSRFVLASEHPSLQGLDLSRCHVLLVVDVHTPQLQRLETEGSMQLTHLAVRSSCLRRLEACVMLHLQSVALDCPALVKLNLTGASRLTARGLQLQCPQLKRLLVHSTSPIHADDFVHR
ncbi:hypothetical protein SPRG_16596 [Saprolegnia parasitica CBS 223.65]|uniref:F-box/LRR-repeat protein 15/At3g58940/PEG3-like LRR domain-containing protein n=1 Tax=Saprolegnia parasitica (strain CBS 223.65) TaxID=695850 RepID=A0A067BUR0_SAPPC|nr:hypothetical protein SPRG_16596 [Saprolegnia parasitica CBS 223.65]KDO18026.1 hypothetical protein SPRG_16596 [Saprolegnia parasitica CBS 223.65]|eukprot:XP_012211269.1 hypothetical protein SPRG_16596 [Saprolegnia parasitica CBS 223.65]